MTTARRREYLSAYQRRWRVKNAAHVKAWRNAHSARNRAKLNADHVAYMERHPDKAAKAKEGVKQWISTHPVEVSAYRLRRKHRLITSEEDVPLIKAFLLALSRKRYHRCYYCGKTRLSRKAIQIDHVIPVSKGGKHTPSNLCVACVRCNQQKKAKLISHWQQRSVQQPVLSL